MKLPRASATQCIDPHTPRPTRSLPAPFGIFVRGPRGHQSTPPLAADAMHPCCWNGATQLHPRLLHRSRMKHRRPMLRSQAVKACALARQAYDGSRFWGDMSPTSAVSRLSSTVPPNPTHMVTITRTQRIRAHMQHLTAGRTPGLRTLRMHACMVEHDVAVCGVQGRARIWRARIQWYGGHITGLQRGLCRCYSGRPCGYG